MIKVDIFSGFLGAGKTTLIKKLIKEAYSGEKLVLIENEFGDIGIDGGFMKEAGIEINEINSGCICCSLVGDFGDALKKVISDFAPERILIEPSGVGKLSDIIKAVQNVDDDRLVLNTFATVVDAGKCKMYHKNFGEFFNNQIENASCVILSHTAGLSQEKLDAAIETIKELNQTATVITTDWDKLNGKQILTAMEKKDTLEAELEKLKDEDAEYCEECGHVHAHGEHHHHHDDDDDDDDHCECHHHHHDDDDDDDDHCECHNHHHDDDDDDDDHCECHHHHHDDDDDDDDHCECHHHHHDDDDDDDHCECGHDHHSHHHHHHADEVFQSWGKETANEYYIEEITAILNELYKEETYGVILRAKGIVAGHDGNWIHFDYVPGTPNVRTGPAEVTGRICVIGSKINEKAIETLFIK